MNTINLGDTLLATVSAGEVVPLRKSTPPPPPKPAMPLTPAPKAAAPPAIQKLQVIVRGGLRKADDQIAALNRRVAQLEVSLGQARRH